MREVNRANQALDTAKKARYRKAKGAQNERLKQACNDWYGRHKNKDNFMEDRREYAREWRAKTPGYFYGYSDRRRKRVYAADGRHTRAEVMTIFESQKGCCAACGCKKPLTVDHIVPLARGGSDWASNLQGLCERCNKSKGARTMDEFLAMKEAA